MRDCGFGRGAPNDSSVYIQVGTYLEKRSPVVLVQSPVHPSNIVNAYPTSNMQTIQASKRKQSGSRFEFFR